MKPIEKYIFNICRVPEVEHEEILDAVGFTDTHPQVSFKGRLAWAVLNVYDQSPLLIISAVFTVIVFIPFLVFLRIFSAF